MREVGNRRNNLQIRHLDYRVLRDPHHPTLSSMTVTGVGPAFAVPAPKAASRKCRRLDPEFLAMITGPSASAAPDPVEQPVSDDDDDKQLEALEPCEDGHLLEGVDPLLAGDLMDAALLEEPDQLRLPGDDGGESEFDPDEVDIEDFDCALEEHTVEEFVDTAGVDINGYVTAYMPPYAGRVMGRLRYWPLEAPPHRQTVTVSCFRHGARCRFNTPRRLWSLYSFKRWLVLGLFDGVETDRQHLNMCHAAQHAAEPIRSESHNKKIHLIA